jgi:ectoine hydroxylase-related dioxygenase (phytanoyl-CoA dioxygenase family)
MFESGWLEDSEHMDTRHVVDLREDGFAIIRGFLDRDEIAAIRQATDQIYQEGLKHHASYRDGNLLFEIMNDPGAMKRLVLQAHWFAWINKTLEQQRRSHKMFEVLAPLLGPDIKQVANQLHWKDPGGKYTFYRMHQDVRFRERPELSANLDRNYVTTGLAVNRQGVSNGGLKVVRGSHKLGYLGLSDDQKYIMVGNTEQGAELAAAGIDARDVVQLEMEPGDLAIWTLYTVHGSGPNVAGERRILLINSYVRAEDSPHRGEWAFRDDRSVPLGPEPEICKYEQLREHPGPFYLDEDWSGESKATGEQLARSG